MIDLIAQQIERDYPEGQEGMRQKLDALGVEWHCPGRHGVVRNIRTGQTQEVLRILTYFFGKRCAWKQGRDIEFVHMTKVFPPPSKPWGWCGTSVLFADWQQEETDARNAMQAFSVGDEVEFEYKGQKHTGVVSNFGRTRLTIVEPGQQGKWHMPATSVKHVTSSRLIPLL